jgi:hypothetical protein
VTDRNNRPQLPKRRHLAYELIPQRLAKTIPCLGATEGQSERLAYVKLFTPDSAVGTHGVDDQSCYDGVGVRVA